MVKNITSTQYEYRCLNLEFIFMIISTVQKHTFPINCCRVQSSPIFWQMVVPTNLSDNPCISTKFHCHFLATNPTQPNVIYVCRFWCYRFVFQPCLGFCQERVDPTQLADFQLSQRLLENYPNLSVSFLIWSIKALLKFSLTQKKTASNQIASFVHFSTTWLPRMLRMARSTSPSNWHCSGSFQWYYGTW